MTRPKKIPEYWTSVPGSNKYQVSNYGNFRRIIKDRIKSIFPYLKKEKWLFVKVDFNGLYKEYQVHKIVASVFLDKPTNSDMVLYHKNGIITDNYAGNLEWITRSHLGKKTGGQNSRCIPVIQFDIKTGEIINFYKSISAAARDNYIHKETISQVIRGQLKTAAGFGWKIEGTEFEGYDS